MTEKTTYPGPPETDKLIRLTHRVAGMEHPLKQLCDNAGIDYQYDGTDNIPEGSMECVDSIIYEACENLDDLDISKLIQLARNQEEVIRSLGEELGRLSKIKDRIPRSHKDCTCCAGKCLLPMIYHELYGDIR